MVLVPKSNCKHDLRAVFRPRLGGFTGGGLGLVLGDLWKGQTLAEPATVTG